MKNSFLIYYDFEEQTAALTDAQVGRLMPSLDTNREKYDRVCQRNKRNRAKALLTTGDDR